jgi:adenine-specific DNA-methyltransferase
MDCFAGSGSTALAALSLGRKSVSIEIDPRLVGRIVEKVKVWEKAPEVARKQSSLRYSEKREVTSQLPLLLVLLGDLVVVRLQRLEDG